MDKIPSRRQLPARHERALRLLTDLQAELEQMPVREPRHLGQAQSFTVADPLRQLFTAAESSIRHHGEFETWMFQQSDAYQATILSEMNIVGLHRKAALHISNVSDV